MKTEKVKHNRLREMSLIWGVKPRMMILQFKLAQQIKTDAVNLLALGLQLLRNDIVDDGVHVMILLRCMRYNIIVQNEVQKYFESEGCCILPDDYRPLSFENIVFGTSLIGHSLFQDPNLL